MSLMMTMSILLKLMKKLSFEGKNKSKRISIESLMLTKKFFDKGEAETLVGFILEISGNFPMKGQQNL
jgi:hypothetical protein